MRLELSRRAQADLDDIRDYSLDRFGNRRAILYLDAIEHALRRLLDHPQIGSQHADIGEAVLSYPIGEHRIFYEARAGHVYVIRVLHKVMDVERWV
jgi:toxin ParE1/3/4